MSDQTDDKYPNYRRYLEAEFEVGRLCIVAAKAKVGEGELIDIVVNSAPITDDIANCLALVTEPQADQWTLDPDDPQFDEHPDLSNDEIVRRLRFARSEGVLDVIAQVSGVKGGVATLDEICDRGGKLDPITKSLLLNVMTEDGPDD